MAKVLIQDGYTRKTFCPAQSGIPDVHYSYRPALYSVSEAYYAALRANDADTIVKIAFQLLSKQLQSWEVESLDGQGIAKIEEATIRYLPRPVIQHMLNSVLGYGSEEQSGDIKN